MSFAVKSNIFLLFMFLSLGCSKDTPTDPVDGNEPTTNYVDYAERAFQALESVYWDDSRSIFYANNTKNTNVNYWWQAHAMDALVDASIRVNDDRYFDKIAAHYNGVKNANHGYENDYYDDMAWMGIALVRAYEITKVDEYLNTAIFLWHDIKTGWNDNQGGGIAWNKNQLSYKNTPSNASTAILCCRLYNVTNEKKYLNLAENIMNWLQNVLVDKPTGLVWDGVGRNGGTSVDKGWLFTYNQGIYIGACTELFNITGDVAWRERAIKTADNAMTAMCTVPNILKDEGGGDGGLFKGILVRYMKFFADQPFVKKSKSDAYNDFLKHNADRLWLSGKSKASPFIFNSDWSAAPEGDTDLAVHLSGLFLMEACAAMD
jgi:predicted alpha-1,6-mannanase (GH76 family)